VKEKLVDILLVEYQKVNEHWLFATKQKEAILNITVGIITTIAGAIILDKSLLDTVVFPFPLFLLLIIIIYYQKSTDYWISSLALDSIEKRINKLISTETLSFKSRFKEIQFKSTSAFPITPSIILQIIRNIILLFPILICLIRIYELKGIDFHLISDVGAYFFVIIFFYFNRKRVIKEGKKISDSLFNQLKSDEKING
jgi:hypothetical protein